MVGSVTGRLDFISDIGVYSSSVVAIGYLEEYGAIVTIASDGYLVIWTVRVNNCYWPSVVHMLPATGKTLSISKGCRLICAGLLTGAVSLINLNYDLNSIQSESLLNPGEGISPVTSLFHNRQLNIVGCGLLDGTIKFFDLIYSKIHTTLTLNGSPKFLQVDERSLRVFAATDRYVYMIKLEWLTDGFVSSIISKLEYDRAIISSLNWDINTSSLLVGLGNGDVHMTIIRGDVLLKYNFFYHDHPITSVQLISSQKQLLTFDSQGTFIVWDLSVSRKEASPWNLNSNCDACGDPFFWNFKTMFSLKKFGGRRHHCRNCGKSLCENCCRDFCSIPDKGFEKVVRVCNVCFEQLNPTVRPSLIQQYYSKCYNAVSLIEPTKGHIYAAVGFPIKMWKIDGIGR